MLGFPVRIFPEGGAVHWDIRPLSRSRAEGRYYAEDFPVVFAGVARDAISGGNNL